MGGVIPSAEEVLEVLKRMAGTVETLKEATVPSHRDRAR
jgi:hypothetical protein